MQDIRNLVDRIEEVLGPSAESSRVEALAASLLSSERANGANPDPIVSGASLCVSLVDCSSLLTKTVRARAYDKIRRIGSHLDPALRKTSIEGFRHVAVSPISGIAGGASGSEFIVLARMMDAAASDCGASTVSGFGAAVDRNVDSAAAALLSVVAEALHSTNRVIVDVRAASDEAGINLDGVLAAAAAFRRLESAPELALRGEISGASASFPPLSFPDADLRITVDAATLIEEVLRAAPDAAIHDLCDVLSAAAFTLGRRIARQGGVAAAEIRRRAGLDVGFGGIDVARRNGVSPATFAAREPVDDALRVVPFVANEAFVAAILRGLGGAVRHVRLLPRRETVAFANSTSIPAAAGAIADRLAAVSASRAPLAVHAAFTDRKAGDVVSIGPFHDVVVEDPPESALLARGGRIPAGTFLS